MQSYAFTGSVFDHGSCFFRLWTFHTQPSTFSLSHVGALACCCHPQYSRENSQLSTFITAMWYHFQFFIFFYFFFYENKFSQPHNMKDLKVRWYQSVVTYGQEYILERWDSVLTSFSFRFSFFFAFWISFAVSKLNDVCEYLGLRLLMQLPTCWPFPLYPRMTSHWCLLQLFNLFQQLCSCFGD